MPLVSALIHGVPVVVFNRVRYPPLTHAHNETIRTLPGYYLKASLMSLLIP
jgi:hypothetical protein